MAKRFAYVSIGVLALALAFHLGAQQSTASTGLFAGISGAGSAWVAVTQDGEVWATTDGGYPYNQGPDMSGWQSMGTIATPTSVDQTSWGAIKRRHE